ncbi:MAG: flagellar basal body P-ring protein FlgI, partial [Phycisphaerales bacterium]|nr:flagellar basal body P-ring protein FlgI [Phycisphaerales bacterium]
AMPRAMGAGGVASAASAGERYPASISIQDIARLDGQGKSQLHGLGLVVGLDGSGDSGSERPLSIPLTKLYESNGLSLTDLKDVAKAKSVAVVWVEASTIESGAHTDDRLDVTVHAMHGATSLKDGFLVECPLTGPFATDDTLYAMASGRVSIEGSNPRSGRVRGGAQVVSTIPAPKIGSHIKLVIDDPYRGWPTARTIANEVNGTANRLDEDEAAAPIARALSETLVEVQIPPQEQADPANFLARILSTRFSPTLLDLPAQVIVNEATGSIVVTGDVEISPVVVQHRDLVVTTTLPPPVATSADPIITRDTWVGLQTTGRASERARLGDLLEAFKQLNVPVNDQIAILKQIHDSGHLHAKFITK